jgi:hypothetical protein
MKKVELSLESAKNILENMERHRMYCLDLVYAINNAITQNKNLNNQYWKSHNWRVTMIEPTFREVMTWVKDQECIKHIDCNRCYFFEKCEISSFFTGDITNLDISKVIEAYLIINDSNNTIR